MYGIIVGCGRLGSALATAFSQEGHDVVVIDRDRKAFDRLGSGFNGSTVVGTGIDEEVLRQAGIEKADFVCAVTSSDTVNLMVAQVARKIFNVQKVVARIFEPQKEEIYRDLGIEAICITHTGVHEIMDALRLEGLFNKKMSLGAGLLDVVSFTATEAIAGKSCGEISIPRKFRVISINRDGHVVMAENDDIISPGDVLTAIIRIDAEDVVLELLGLARPDRKKNGGTLKS